jgi:hypothetical protein
MNSQRNGDFVGSMNTVNHFDLEVSMPGLVTTLCLLGAFLVVVVPIIAALLADR